MVGFGCTTCIGNSGPLPAVVSEAIREADLVAAAVLSGNRNFEGRIHPNVRANYLASPPLVVAYAIAGSVDADLVHDPLGHDPDGIPVYLREIWPTSAEIQAAIAQSVKPEMYQEKYAGVFTGNETWNAIQASDSELYSWDPDSTYIQEPPFFTGLRREVPDIQEIQGARVLAILGDSITTDHISPAGSFSSESPAGKFLIQKGVDLKDFNSYGSRRGNDRVMSRGTLANIRLKNRMVPGVEGGWTIHQPTGEQMSIYEAAVKYREEKISLVVLAGKEYGTGSSRDWAAKGVMMLGVRAVIAESFERIHRSNLVGMGVLPLQFLTGENVESLGLEGTEKISVRGLNNSIQPKEELTVTAERPDGTLLSFQVTARLETPVEVNYFRNGGILQTVLRGML